MEIIMTNSTIEAAVIGAAGYTAGELIRILVNHPNVTIGSLVSQSQTGKPVSSTHMDLLPYGDLEFTESLEGNPDVVFLCMGHGKSRAWVENYTGEARIIDLSQDFRHQETAGSFVYGLPEYQREAIIKAQNIANPGCFATAIQLALLPLAENGLLNDDINIHGTTGSTGAGQSLSETSHFSWRNNNVSLYKALDHQHLIEINETVSALQPAHGELVFLPMRGNFTRGIFVSVLTRYEGTEEDIQEAFNVFYQDASFTFVTQQSLHLKQVVNTNLCLVNVTVKKGFVLVTSIIDNLLKGASGQAVQNMNLIFGLDETAGLQLKGSYF